MNFITFSQLLIDNESLLIAFTASAFFIVFLFKRTIWKSSLLIVLTTIVLVFTSMFCFLSLIELDDEQYVAVSKLECVSENYSTPKSIKKFFNNNDTKLTALEYLNIQIVELDCFLENNPRLPQVEPENNDIKAVEKAKAKLLSL